MSAVAYIMRRSVRSALLGFASLACLLFLFLCGDAQAGPNAPDDGCLTEPVCRSHYMQAVHLFENGRFETALPEFQAAYERRQMPWLLINIGRTLHRLGRPREALDYYERYKQIETKPDPETLDRVEKYIQQAKMLSEAPAAPVVAPASTPAPTPTPEPEKKETPVYKKWWFWTAIGGAVAAAVIIGVAVGVTTSSSSPSSPPPPKHIPDGIMIYQPTF